MIEIRNPNCYLHIYEVVSICFVTHKCIFCIIYLGTCTNIVCDIHVLYYFFKVSIFNNLFVFGVIVFLCSLNISLFIFSNNFAVLITKKITIGRIIISVLL